MEKLTLKEAIELGYSYAGIKDGESVISLEKIFNNIENYKEREDLLLCDIESTSLAFTEDSVSEVVAEMIDCQDEFYTEYDLSVDAFKGTDEIFKALTSKINENLSKRKFWFVGDIKLDLTNLENTGNWLMLKKG